MTPKSGVVQLIAVGGNAELTLGAASSLREMSDGINGGELGTTLFRTVAQRPPAIKCNYFAWTGTSRENDWWVPAPPMHLNGANRIIDSLGYPNENIPIVIVGWSNGGDTAYNVAKKNWKAAAGRRTRHA